MKSGINNAIVALVFGTLLGSTVASAAPQLTYTLMNAQLGGMNQKILIPFVADVPGGNPSVQVAGMVSQLKMIRPDLYQEVIITLDPGFGSNGRATLETGVLQGENLMHVVSEVFHSLTVLGMRQLQVPSMGQAPVSAAMIPYPVAQITVPAWKALPPAKAQVGLVQVSEDVVLPAEVFNAKFQQKDAELGAALALGLKSPSARIRATIAQNMSQLGVANAGKLILPLTQDVDREVRIAAVQALETFKADPSVQARLEDVVKSDSESAVKSAAVQVLVNAGRSEFQVFLYIDKLNDPNPMTVIEAIRQLAAAKNDAASASLVDVLTHRSPEVREEAIKGLMIGKNGAGMSRGLQLQAVADDVKLKLAKGMTGLDNPAFVDEGLAYIVIAGTAAESVRAAEALGTRKSRNGVDALIEGLNYPDQAVQVACSSALGSIGDPRGLAPLADFSTRAAGAAKEAAQNGAVTLLKSLSLDQVIDFSNNPNVMVRRFALESLGAFAQGGRNMKVVQELQNKLMDSDTTIRRAAAVSLSEIEDPSISALFRGMMNDADPIVRSRVAVTLGWSRDPSAGVSLVGMLKDSDSEVKRQAANSLARRKDRGGLDELLKYVNYGKPEVRSAVMGAVVAVSNAQDNEKLMPVYQNALYDQEVSVKLAAIEGMARNLGTPAAPSAISNLSSIIIDPNEDVQLAVVEYLGTAKDAGATDGISRALFSDFRNVKLAALEALRNNGQENAEKPLQEFISNEQDKELLLKANGVYDDLGL